MNGARIGLVLIALFFCPLAQAYLPPAGFVLNHAVGERSGLKSIEWTAKVTRHAPSGTSEEEIVSSFKETLRVDYVTGKVQISFSSPSDQPLGAIQVPVTKLSPFGRFWLVVSLDPNLSRVKSALEELQILPAHEQEVRLNRVGGKVAWTWGSQTEPVSEVDFQKDEFTPLRYQSGRLRDGVSFQSIAIAGASAKVPKQASVRFDGRNNVFDFELKSVKADAASEKKFVETPVTLPGIKEWIKLVR
ncbi:MAG: hypothetical protein EBX52_07630 [Proteobacteria bacterium]|nr:hypothetical protein [Pseudomonadota bacterium]